MPFMCSGRQAGPPSTHRETGAPLAHGRSGGWGGPERDAMPPPPPPPRTPGGGAGGGGAEGGARAMGPRERESARRAALALKQHLGRAGGLCVSESLAGPHAAAWAAGVLALADEPVGGGAGAGACVRACAS